MIDYNSLKNRTMQSRGQVGFTLIELMIIIAIIAILVNMAMVSYKDYLVRSKISSGIALAASSKAAVSEYYSNSGKMPVDNSEAGLAQADTITNEYVDSISIGTVPTTGTITISYQGITELKPGDTLLLSPNPSAGSIKWNCLSNTMEHKLLPSSCR